MFLGNFSFISSTLFRIFSTTKTAFVHFIFATHKNIEFLLVFLSE
ncbi:MAG: hypothetical protein Q8S84_00555 [bacterium]|nr:hypothetical protein [bacterium]